MESALNDPAHPTVPDPSAVAVRLGYLAVVPFVCGAALVWLIGPAHRPLAAQALSAYAATVVSFIGAIHWGLGFPQARPASRLFLWGVVPSLVACVALLTTPRPGLVLHAVMLVTCYPVDRAVYPKEGVARWLPLRLRLTVVATAACLVGAWAAGAGGPG